MTPSGTRRRTGLPGRTIQRLRDMSVGTKLYVGFGSLVFWMLTIVLMSHLTSADAISENVRTRDLRLPSALATVNLEREIHELNGTIQSYLLLGEPAYRDRFRQNVVDVETHLAELAAYSSEWSDEGNQRRLEQLKRTLPAWLELTEAMFAATGGKRASDDLFVMRSQAALMAGDVLAILGELRASQTSALAAEFETSNIRLTAGQIQTAVGGSILAFSALVLALAIRRDIAGPVLRLTEATALIMDGDMEARASVESRDEIGRLAASFNDMTDRMKTSLAEAERRALIIETSSQVSQRLSTILDQKQLMQEVVEQVRSAFDYDYAHLFLIDDGASQLVTAGGVDDTGQALMQQGFTVGVDQGLVGRAALTNKPVLVPDVTKDDGHLPHPLLPHTKAEIAVPISVGARVLGVLDVQQNVVNGLSKVDLDVLHSIASQVAVALVNARLYDETQRRARYERLVNEISQKILNTTSVERAMQLAIREVGRAVSAERTVVQLNVAAENGKGQRGKRQIPSDEEQT